MEVGDGEDGCTKLVPGTGVSPLDGSGDMTCALPSEVLEVETFAVCKPADHTTGWEGYFHTLGVVVFEPDHSYLLCCCIKVAGNTGGDNSLAATLVCSEENPDA